MIIRGEELDWPAAYKLLTGIVVPRPIAWVATVSAAGVSNIAPFSCFTFVSSDPPMVGFNAGLRQGRPKDTGRNIAETQEFVVNIVDEPLLEPMHRSAADFGPEDSEIEALGLETLPSEPVRPPRIARAPIALECVLDQMVPFGRSGSRFIVGEVKLFHIADGLLQNGRIDTAALRPVARLAGPVYGTLGPVIRLTKSEV